MRKDIFPSVKEALPVVVLTALFLLLTAVCIGAYRASFNDGTVSDTLFCRKNNP